MNEVSTNAKLLAAEMRAIAQTAILAWFADLLRVRIATQSPTQRALTMAMLEEGLATTLSRHACQNMPSPMSETDTLKASLFKDAFKELSMQLLTTMGSGLTPEEQAAIK
jgi:hypothetical protein